MLDIKLFTDNTELLTQNLQKRNVDLNLIQKIQGYATQRRKLIAEVEKLKSKRNQASTEIASAKKSGQSVDALLAEMKVVAETIKTLDQELFDLEQELQSLALTLPNMPHASVPFGKDEHDNQVVKTWGEPRKFSFAPQDHVVLGEKLKMLDLERAAKITGSRFSILRGWGARLERALAQWMLDVHTKEHDYLEVATPLMANRATLRGTGQLPKFEADLFKIEGSDYYLIPTAEVTVTNIYRDEILESHELPMRMTAFTPCFRSEAGSYGKDTRGLIRQHQFNKVELVQLVHPEKSYEAHEALTRQAETILERLELPYRRMLLCSGDMGFGAAKCYDLEVWLPGQSAYREISSCSNFEDFQARRANLRYRPGVGEKPRLVHTLNGSGLAIGRTWVAILENYQQEDGSIQVPKVLVPYLGVDVLREPD